MKTQYLIIALLASFTLLLSSCTKQLGNDVIKIAVTSQLPNYVSVIDISLSEQKNTGTSEEPIWKGTFHAKIDFDEDIFTKDRERADVIFLDLVKKAHDTIAFSWKFVSKLSSDKKWDTTINFNDDFQLPQGKPAREWPSKRKIVVGTSDEDKYYADQEAEAKKVKEREELRKKNEEDARKADQELRAAESRKTNNS